MIQKTLPYQIVGLVRVKLKKTTLKKNLNDKIGSNNKM
jgi:hypothetical protein